jgi:predicted kinase
VQKQAWRPELVIFVGLQASGKSTLYRQRFFTTHVRINLDMLKTRHRERTLLQACVAMQQHCVVDNTNVLRAERAVYITAARPARFRVVGYFFEPDIQACIARNEQRTGREHIPVKGILSAAKRMQPPRYDEGFDALYHVRIDPADGFRVTFVERHR